MNQNKVEKNKIMQHLDIDRQRPFLSKKLDGRPKNGRKLNTRYEKGDNTKNTDKSLKNYKTTIHITLGQ